jgi:hypothetical protein
MVFIILFLSFSLKAQESAKKTPMQRMLEKNTQVVTREYKVNIDGVEYKKIETEGEVFYFKALERKDEVPMSLCQRPEGWKSEQLIEASLKLFKRKLVFISALQEQCSTKIRDDKGRPTLETNNRNSSFEINPVVGVYLPEGKDDKIKNKKILIPLGKDQGGLSGDVNWDDSIPSFLGF